MRRWQSYNVIPWGMKKGQYSRCISLNSGVLSRNEVIRFTCKCFIFIDVALITSVGISKKLFLCIIDVWEYMPFLYKESQQVLKSNETMTSMGTCCSAIIKKVRHLCVQIVMTSNQYKVMLFPEIFFNILNLSESCQTDVFV